MSDKRIFCTEYSREAGEELAGTVKPADQWLLIEQRAVWPRNATDAFSERVQEPPSNQSNQPLFSVCTHGIHDLCCAKFGNEIYSELRKLTDNVWQVSLLGGCRLAPIKCQSESKHGVISYKTFTQNAQLPPVFITS